MSGTGSSACDAPGGAGYDPAMGVEWNGELVDQLESHWQHRLRPRLDGLTDDEYFWQPVPRLLDDQPPRSGLGADGTRSGRFHLGLG